MQNKNIWCCRVLIWRLIEVMRSYVFDFIIEVSTTTDQKKSRCSNLKFQTLKAMDVNIAVFEVETSILPCRWRQHFPPQCRLVVT